MKLLHRGIRACLFVLVALAVAAPPAAAHTGFESSDPADGAVLGEPVEVITLVYSGEAEPTGEGFQVLDPGGEVRVPIEATTTDGRTWVLRFDPPIASGVAGVRWAVKAPDAHPIEGAFSFTVAELAVVPTVEPRSSAVVPNPTDAPVEASPPAAASATADTATSPEPRPEAAGEVAAAPAAQAASLADFLAVEATSAASSRRAGAAGRVLTLAGTLVGIGALVFVATVIRGDRREVQRVLFWVRRGGLLVAVGALVEFVAQLATEAGGGWSGLWSPSAWTAVTWSSFGVATGLRLVGGFALATGARLDTAAATEVADPVIAIRDLVGARAGGDASGFWADEVPRGRHARTPSGDGLVEPGDHAWRSGVDSAGAAFGAAGILAAHLFVGHTVTKGNRLFTGMVDLIHVAGGAIWAGGIFMLALVLWNRHREGNDLKARQLATRFSVVAAVALVVVGTAGLVLAIIILDSPSELWSTEWGRLLVAKTAFVGVAAAAGGYNHKILIPLMERAPDDTTLATQFRGVVTAEATALAAVAITTAFLVGAAS